MKTPTPQQIARAERLVLDAAKKYGDKAAVDDYSDNEEGALLGISYKYAEMLRAKTPKKPLIRKPRTRK